MKNLAIALFAAAFLFSCGPNQEADTIPDDLEGKRAYLTNLRKQHAELEGKINKLEEEISEMSPEGSQQVRSVTIDTAERKDFKHYVEIQASVQSDDLVNVTSEVPGIITNLPVEEGQNVNKGQLIAKINLEQVNKQIAEIEKSLELAQEVYDRQERLWNQKIGSEIQYLQAKNNKERLEKSMETAKFQLSKGTIYAPISGVIETKTLKAGEMASPGMPIVTILNTNKVKVVAEVPETYLTAVKKGQKVSIEIPALDKTIEAPVTLVGKTINPANRTFAVEVELSNSNGLLKPNLLANMKINDFTNEDVVIVPIEMVQQEANGQSFIYVVGKSDKGEDVAKKVLVETGKAYENEIIIEKGLEGKEIIISKGARFVSDNEPVKIENKG
ncbi:MAG: efflux RND transporter periplasmic adaptor subunit [Saprospiraceae bacterium]